MDIGAGNRGSSVREQAGLPEGRPLDIGIKGVHGIVLGRDIDDVMGSLGRNRDTRHVEGLRIDLPIDRIGELFAKAGLVHHEREQNGLVHVLAGAGQIVVVGEHALRGGLRRDGRGHGRA